MKTTYLLLLIALLTVACARSRFDDTSSLMDSGSEPQPMQAKRGRMAFCGVESYKSGTGSICGPKTYKLSRTAHCGPELYNQRQDQSCPGYIARDSFVNKVSGSCSSPAQEPAACPAGYINWRNESQTALCAGRRDIEVEKVVNRERYCLRKEFIPTCRRFEFGVEAYKSCRHAMHGVETYHTCRNAVFGIDQHKACDYYLRPDEVEVFVSERKSKVDLAGMTMLRSRGLFYAAIADDLGFACLIKRNESDLLLDGVIADLKSLYKEKFGSDYDGSRYQCDGSSHVVTIEAYNCTATASDAPCQARAAWQNARDHLAVTTTDIRNIKSNLATIGHAALQQKFNRLETAVTDYMNRDK